MMTCNAWTSWLRQRTSY